MKPLRHLPLCLVLAACAPPPTGPVEPRPEVVLHGVHIRSFRQNQLTAVGTAERLAYERSSSNADIDRSILRLPSKRPEGKGVYTDLGGVEIRAPKAEGNLNAQKVEAFGGVQVRSASGMVATTERAMFDGIAFETTGSGPLQVRAPNYALDAVGFALRSRDEVFEFGGPLRSGVKGAR